MSLFSTDERYDGDDYIETITGDAESVDKLQPGQQIVCINSDGEYNHQIEVDEYNDDQLEDDTIETSPYERITATSLNSRKGENSSVYYITTPNSNSSINNDSQTNNTSRPKIIVQDQQVDSNDSDVRFLLSCLPTMKRLSLQKNSLARVQILDLLHKIEWTNSN